MFVCVFLLCACVSCVIDCAMLCGLRVRVCLGSCVLFMCQFEVFVMFCVLFYGVCCSWCLCVCYVFACVACGVLCDVVCIVCVALCGRVVDMFVRCEYDLCVLSYGLCLCCCACVRVGLNVFVRVVCDLLCDAV